MKQRLFRWMLFALTMLLTIGSNVQAAKKVHTLGDSTMANYDESVTETRGWGMYFGNFLTNGWTAVNYARGGRDSRSGYSELWQTAKNNVEAGDYVLIQFAHNDQQYNGMDNLELQAYYTSIGDATNAAAVQSDGRGTTPSTTYKENLKKIVDEVKAKGAYPVLVGPVCRSYFSNGTIRRNGQHDLGDNFQMLTATGITSKSLPADDHTMDYAYQMKQLAEQEGVPYIDMTAATKSLYEDYGQERCHAELFTTKNNGQDVDATHYKQKGALLVARLGAQLLKDAGILAENIEIPSDFSIIPANADLGDVYVGQSGIKEMTLSGLGLDPSTGSVSLSATEGIQLSLDKQDWQTSLSVAYENGTLIKNFYIKVAITAAGAFAGTLTAVTPSNVEIQVPVTVNGVELGGGDPFSVTWALTSTNTPVVEGDAIGANTKYVNMGTYGLLDGFGALVAPGDGKQGSWTAAIDDQNQYVEFAVTAPEGKKLDINHIAMDIKAQGGGSLYCHVYYSTDGFQTRKTLLSSDKLTGTLVKVNDESVMAKVDEGDQLLVRVYPWSANNDNGRWICIQNVVVSGQSKDAAGVNIAGTITYALDKGGLSQGDDAMMDPNELSAGFAGKTWTAGSALTVENTLSYRGASGESNITQTRIYNGTDASFASTADADNTLTLTLTPEDGFSFVPTKLSFQAARYGTDGGTIGASVDAGETHVVLVSNGDVNRDGKSLTVASFSEEISGVTATADKPLKVNFAFLGLGKTKQMGLSNVVIEGTLVGAAAQVTKYALNTQVLPSDEAGSISRDPDLEMYKDGSQVTLKATKNFGYKFKEWQDATGAVVSTYAETTVTMDAEKTMKAVFETVPVYTVTTKVTNDAERDLGSITLTPNEHSNKYEAGTKIQAVANETKILKFLSWTDENENANAGATREVTVTKDMTLVANYEVQDFIAVFDASTTSAYATQGSYPFAADMTWDSERNAKVSVVKQSDGSLVKGTNATPVVRNRANSGVLTTLSGVFQNGYNTAEIAWQYQFSTVGFTSAKFTADMAAKNAATKNWKAQISTDGTTFTDLGQAWEVAANTLKPLTFDLPAEAIGKSAVYIRIMGTGSDPLSDKYQFNAGTSDEGLNYTTNSESQVGNVYVLGEAIVKADETAPVVTSTIPADNATGVSATGKITISFDERVEAASAAGAANVVATLTNAEGNSVSLTPTWSSRSVSFDYSALDYGKQYVFKMPANFVQDKSGNKLAEAVTISFTVMDRPTIAKGAYDQVVSTTEELSAAIKAANGRADKSARYRIFVKKGTYKLPTGEMKHYKHTSSDGATVYWEGDLPDPITYIKAANISFIGEDRDATILTQDISNDDDMLFEGQFGKAHKYEEIKNSPVLQLDAEGTYLQDITIKSGINDALGRNLAILDNSTKTIYKNTLLYGYQDTWTSNKQTGMYYFEGGQVRGRTDYLCGSGDAYFKGLELLQMASGYAAVPSTPKNIGWVFKDCQFSASGDGAGGTYTLGRPWGKGTPVAVFIDTKMNVTPKAEGWNEMSGGWPKRFAEYNSTNANGVAIDLSSRKTVFADTHENNPVLTAEEAADYSDMSRMFGDWQPTLATEQAPVPTNVTASGATLTWDDSNYGLLWAVCKDGDVIAFTDEPSYEAAESGSYSVRAANEMGGLSEASASVTVSINYVKITPAKNYTTYVTGEALDFSNVSGLKAYVAVSTSATAVSMQEVGAVPAATPLLLIAEVAGQDYTVPAAAASVSATAPAVNLLKAGDGTTIIGGTSRYDFVLKDGEFHRAAEGTVDKGKAYLHLESLPAAGASVFVIDITGSTTGIENLNPALSHGEGAQSVYNLSGQRVSQPRKGLYIVNGRKVVIK